MAIGFIVGIENVLKKPPHSTIGVFVDGSYSVAGHFDRDKHAVNYFLLQWLVNHNMKKGWYVKTAPI